MRYTTIIDITEYPTVRRSKNATLLYLHMALKAGYHDNDRDCLNLSIRQLAATVGLTVSATRCALKLLIKNQLISRQGNSWRVSKWIPLEPPTPRAQMKKQEQEKVARQYEDELKRKELEKYRQEVYTAIRSSTREELEAWLQELKEGKYLYHYGARIRPNNANIEWLIKIINHDS